MSEFHRMVTYLYLYENNQKTRNVGYAKIEKRNAECCVEIHMKNTGLIAHDIPVYFYTQKNNQFPGILLGSIHLNCGIGDFKKLLSSDDISDTGYNISDIKGIFMPVSEQEMILSQWDNHIFYRNAFLPADECVEEDTIVVADTAVTEDSVVAKDTAVTEDFVVAKDTAVMKDSVPTNDTLKAAEAAPDFSLKTVVSQSPRWDFIMENFPSVAPFPSETSFDWVQLELKDLRLLPKSYWYLGNNSFLLHGFFNYHHLLLGKKRDAHPYQWVLGIPGVFQNPERVMAAIFGFPEFHSTSESANKNGRFGYWLRPLE